MWNKLSPLPCLYPGRKIGRVKRIWYLSPMRAAKVQASLRIRTVSPEPPLLAHTSSESRGTFRQKARSLAPLNGWVCAIKICQDRMLQDTNLLDLPQMFLAYPTGLNVTHQCKEKSSYTRGCKTTRVHDVRLSFWCYDVSFLSLSAKCFDITVMDR